MESREPATRRLAKRIALLLATLALAGCSQPRVLDSGVQGEVQVLGLPQVGSVARAPVKPASTDLVVRPLGAKQPMLTVRSDENGRFDVALPPGAYTVEKAGDSGGPHKDFVVQAHRFTHLVVQFAR